MSDNVNAKLFPFCVFVRCTCGLDQQWGYPMTCRTHLARRDFILLTFRKITMCSGRCKTTFIHINLFDIRFTALTSSRGPKRKWTSSDALGFCMCFFSLACRGHSDRHTVRRRWREGNWWMREVRSCDISPRGWRPASVSAGYRWTLLQWGAWLAGSTCPL